MNGVTDEWKDVKIEMLLIAERGRKLWRRLIAYMLKGYSN